MFSIKNGFTDM